MSSGLYRTSAYILDIKIVNYTGNKNDLEVEVVDIWGNGIKGILDVAPFHHSLTLRNAPIATSFTDFKIIPTPSASRFIRLGLPDIEVDSPIQIQIINTMGQVVWQQVRQLEKVIGLDLRALKKGSYRVVLEVNGRSISKPFVLL